MTTAHIERTPPLPLPKKGTEGTEREGEIMLFRRLEGKWAAWES